MNELAKAVMDLPGSERLPSDSREVNSFSEGNGVVIWHVPHCSIV